MDINDLGIDLDNVNDPRSFVEGLLWFVRAMREVNNGVKQSMHQFDGDEMAEGVRMMLDKQEEIFAVIDVLATSVLNREG